jgi:predicted acylesterase/phospholipase RssA
VRRSIHIETSNKKEAGMEMNQKRLNLVMEGGGVKGIGLVGAIEEFEKRGYSWAYLAGTSAGAIVATLMAVGYTGAELKDILFGLDFRDIMDAKGFGKVPVIGPLWNLIKNKGLFDGDYILNFMREKVALKTKKNPYTFGDLKRDSKLKAPKLNLMIPILREKGCWFCQTTRTIWASRWRSWKLPLP